MVHEAKRLVTAALGDLAKVAAPALTFPNKSDPPDVLLESLCLDFKASLLKECMYFLKDAYYPADDI